MNTQLLNQYDVKFIKEKEFGEIWHYASGGGIANFLDDIGTNTDGIDFNIYRSKNGNRAISLPPEMDINL